MSCNYWHLMQSAASCHVKHVATPPSSVRTVSSQIVCCSRSLELSWCPLLVFENTTSLPCCYQGTRRRPFVGRARSANMAQGMHVGCTAFRFPCRILSDVGRGNEMRSRVDFGRSHPERRTRTCLLLCNKYPDIDLRCRPCKVPHITNNLPTCAWKSILKIIGPVTNGQKFGAFLSCHDGSRQFRGPAQEK